MVKITVNQIIHLVTAAKVLGEFVNQQLELLPIADRGPLSKVVAAANTFQAHVDDLRQTEIGLKT